MGFRDVFVGYLPTGECVYKGSRGFFLWRRWKKVNYYRGQPFPQERRRFYPKKWRTAPPKGLILLRL